MYFLMELKNTRATSWQVGNKKKICLGHSCKTHPLIANAPIYEIFAIEIFLTWSSTFTMGKSQIEIM